MHREGRACRRPGCCSRTRCRARSRGRAWLPAPVTFAIAWRMSRGREELPLLDVDGAAGPRRRPRAGRSGGRGTRGSAGRRRPRRPAPACAGSWMSVRTGTPSSALTRPRMREALVEARARGTSAIEVRLALSKEALKTNGTPRARGDVADARARGRAACASLSITHGPGDEDERAPAADADRADLDGVHGGHYTGRLAGRCGTAHVGWPFGRRTPPPTAGRVYAVVSASRRPAPRRACAGSWPRRSRRTAGAAAAAST